MANVLEIIKNEITQDYYKNNFPNDGQRFIAWYMRNIHLLDQRQAKDAITDGANDKQIDAVYIDEDEQKIYIVQGKYYLGESVDATPVREVISAWSQFSNLAQLQENANSKLKTKISEIATALEDDSYCVCFELITTSIFTDAAMDDIHSFQTKLSEEDDAELNYSTQFSVVDKQGLEDAYSCVIEQTNPTLNHTIKLEAGKYMTTELGATSVIVAAMPLKECIKLPGIKDGSLFQKNVRQSLGINNTVNKKIKKTINDPNKCGDFFFFHNGITAICNKIEECGNGEFKLYGLNVVNGCQSLNTILSCSENVRKRDDAYVLFRFYEIPQRDRADSISINTNTQSAVKARDLRSKSKQILKLKKAYEAKYSNGFFATKRGEIIPADKDKQYCIELSYLGKNLTIVGQTVCVFRDAQHPLALFLADDRRAAALAHALDDLFVGQHALAARAPVDGHRRLVGKVILKELEEYPLRPFIILRVGRVDHAVPVEAVAEHLELTGEVLDVLLRDDGGMDVVLDGKVLRRQAEGVKADGVQDIVALHALFAADDVHRRERARVADVQTRGGGVREFDQAVELGALVPRHGGVGLYLLPLVLPFFLNGCEIVLHGSSPLCEIVF